jgi:hypothetical protein
MEFITYPRYLDKPTCNKCDSPIECFLDKTCEKCMVEDTFNKGSVEDKLRIHGIINLRILAKKKNIKMAYLTKKQLIKVLVPVTKHSDFPIVDYKL